jgi:3-deoxy-D-manno-octulosonic-acid transferase
MMYFLYNLIVSLARLFLQIIALFNKKIKLFVDGRKETFQKLSNTISNTDKVVWIHCASLGEFEQGRPIIEKIRKTYTNHKIVLTFFSPSGYEVRKNYSEVDVVCYLPLDTKLNARKFIDLVRPEIAIFVKYEFWPNILNELKSRKVTTILVSGIFRIDQVFFKPIGSWMRKSLQTFSHFFVQDENSEKLLNSIGIHNVRVSGDTRFDRVHEIPLQDNTLNFIQEFKQDQLTFVAGSTWEEDEELIVDYINNKASASEKFIIAPHNINSKEIKELQKAINKKTVLFSEKENQNLKDAHVFIIDTIGILTKIYSYADIAYVGGGFETGLHNILEPATFGVPIIIGPKYDKFREAVGLVNEGGCFVVYNKEEFNDQLKELFTDADDRTKKGKITKKFISQNIGATKIVLDYIKSRIN